MPRQYSTLGLQSGINRPTDRELCQPNDPSAR